MIYHADLRTTTYGRRPVILAGMAFVGAVAFVLVKSPGEERAAIATPRTAWSSKSANQSRMWFDFQQQLVSEASMYTPGESSRLVLVGDSITEAWRGTAYGRSCARCEGVPAVLNQTLAHLWPRLPLVLAISGDQTQHVLWRLANGEVSTAMATDRRLLVSLMIGTNNLGRGHLPDETHKGILAVARWLLQSTAARLLVNALLPRGDGHDVLPALCPPRCAKGGKPFTSFMPPINKVNAQLEDSVARLDKEFPGRVGFVNCGSFFDRWSTDGEEVPLELMPDRLHPNAAGHRLMAPCLSGALAKLDARKRHP